MALDPGMRSWTACVVVGVQFPRLAIRDVGKRKRRAEVASRQEEDAVMDTAAYAVHVQNSRGRVDGRVRVERRAKLLLGRLC